MIPCMQPSATSHNLVSHIQITECSDMIYVCTGASTDVLAAPRRTWERVLSMTGQPRSLIAGNLDEWKLKSTGRTCF